jgi:lipoprotein-anchoring transpeptidase ErfK/SrfK
MLSFHSQGDRMRVDRLPRLPLLALAAALLIGCPAGAQAEPQNAPKAEAQPEANSTAAQPEAAPADTAQKPEQKPQDAKGEPAKEQGEAAAKSEEPASKIVINIDKSKQEMTVFVDGVEQYSWPVSTGKRGYSTPSGTYTATSMNEMWYSKEWDNAPMPHAIFFMKDGHAIHGSLEVKNLGKPASHGCVRISPANATKLFALVKEKGLQNTQVVLAGVTPGGEAKVASEPDYGGGAQWDGPGWGGQGRGYYYPPPPRRRGLFGGWFRQQPYYDGPQGYYRPRGYYRGY